MLVIRLFRTGKKNQPSYKIVVTDKRNAVSKGRFVEEVGFYNPLTKEKKLNAERIQYWISVGAQPSETLHNMLISEKIIEGIKIPKHNKPKKKEEKIPVPEPTVQASPKAQEKSEEKPVTSGQELETTEQKKSEEKQKETPEEELKQQEAQTEEQKTQEVKKEQKPVEESLQKKEIQVEENTPEKASSQEN